MTVPCSRWVAKGSGSTVSDLQCAVLAAVALRSIRMDVANATLGYLSWMTTHRGESYRTNLVIDERIVTPYDVYRFRFVE